jgi:acetylornithine deacetylase/succinyl-diaminopimelate desuccinylase-like protein
MERATAELQRLVRQPSVAAQGVGIPETVKLVCELVAASGGRTRVLTEGVPGNPVIYAEFDGESEKTLLFYDHYDVQPAEPLDEWTAEPFGGEIREGKIFGRGTSDNKGEIAARLAAIRAVRTANGGKLPCRVKFLIEGEEEIGSPALYPALERYADLFRADGCIWEFGSADREGRPELFGGVKGMAYMQAWVRHADVDMHSSLAAVVDNPAWRLVWALASCKAPDGTVLVPGFYDGITEPTPAQREMALRIPFDPATLVEGYGIKRPLLAQTHAAAIEAMVFRPTCTICGLEAGYTGQGSKTVLPKRAQAKIDCRLVPGMDPQQVFQAFRRHLDAQGFTDVELELLSGQKAYWTDPADPFVKLVAETAREAWGVEPVYHLSSAGTGPMYGFGQYLDQIPVVSTGSGYFGSRAHAPDENIRLDDFAKGVRHMALLIEAMGK